MPRKVNTDQMNEIDEILEHEDPQFLEDLKEIDSDALKVAELEAAFAEAEKTNTLWHRLWHETPPLKLWSLVSAAVLAVGVPLGY